MKKSLINNLLERRVPQIIGSYFVGSTTLILFIDWLITKYGFSDNILQFTWFGLISILPSVLIIAYFHGAPGKHIPCVRIYITYRTSFGNHFPTF
jgi:hypothetical protein